MVAFGNPVQGIIRPPGAPLIVGSFRVTSTFADHVASGRGPGIDIGNGRCNDPLLAMAAGKVSLAGLIGAAKVVRIVHPQYPGYETGYAHLATIEVQVGQLVSKGQRIGTLGSTGATACHLHGGCKVNGVEVDWWPLLIQNGAVEDDMVPIPTGAFKALANKKTIVAAQANFRADRLTSAPVLSIYPVGTAFVPSVSANDGSAAGGATPTLWYGGFLYDDSPAGYVFGWFHSSVLGPLEDAAPDCSAQVKAATDPLNAKITKARLLVDGAKAALV